MSLYIFGLYSVLLILGWSFVTKVIGLVVSNWRMLSILSFASLACLIYPIFVGFWNYFNYLNDSEAKLGRLRTEVLSTDVALPHGWFVYLILYVVVS